MRKAHFMTASLVVLLALVSHAVAAFTDFEDLAPGTRYVDGDTFTSGDLTFRVTTDRTPWLCVYGDPASILGSTEIANGTAWLEIVLDRPVSRISFDIGSYDSGSLLKVNGQTSFEFGYSSLPSLDNTTIAGVDVAVSNLRGHTGKEIGTVTLSGTIHSFSIFGYEMFIDNVSVVPEPATLTLVAIGGVLVLNRRQRTGEAEESRP